MTAAAFCREHNISVHQFHYWKKQLTGTGEPHHKKASVEDLFLRVTEDPGNGGVTVVTNGYRLELAEGFSELTLKRALKILGGGGRP